MIATASILLSPFTMSTGKLLGRSTSSTGAIEEISVGTGLSLSGGTLTATGGGVSSFNTRTGAITLSTADVNNTIVTGNTVGAVLWCTPYNSFGASNHFTAGSSYSCSGGRIVNGSNSAYAAGVSLTGTWKCLDMCEVPVREADDIYYMAYIYRFVRTA